ncbi:hypothetical protein [Halovulum sp. GXIMD14793]
MQVGVNASLLTLFMLCSIISVEPVLINETLQPIVKPAIHLIESPAGKIRPRKGRRGSPYSLKMIAEPPPGPTH